MVLVLTFFLLLPVVVAAHPIPNQEVSKTKALARQLLLQAVEMVPPNQLETLLGIGKLQVLAEDNLSALATYEKIEHKIKTLPLRSENLNFEGEVLERERYEYFLMLATSQWESGLLESGINTLQLARHSIEAIQSPRDRVMALKAYFLTQVQLGLPLHVLESLDRIPLIDPAWGNLGHQKVDTLILTAQALHQHARDKEAKLLLQNALLIIEEIENSLSRDVLYSQLIRNLLIVGLHTMAEESFHEQLSRLNLPSSHGETLDHPKTILKRTHYFVEMAKGLFYLSDPTYFTYVNRALEEVRELSPKYETIYSSALRTIALAKIELHDLEGALTLEEEIVDEDYKNQSLPRIAEAAIEKGELVRAIDLAHRVGKRDPPQEAFLLSEIAIAISEEGDIKKSLKLASQIGFPFRSNVYFSIASITVKTQSLEDALALAEQDKDASFYRPFILMGAAKGLLDLSSK